MFPLTFQKRLIWHIGIFSIAITLMAARISYGYVMPAEQLVEYLSNNFKKIKTVDAVVSTSIIDNKSGDVEKSLITRILIKSPDLVHTIMLENEDFAGSLPDKVHLQLLISNEKERIELLLSWMGINLDEVSFTRIDGIIAYRIGDKDPEQPKILIEKERFIPLLLMYKWPEQPLEDVITVRFYDYRELDHGWYPHGITCSIGNRIVSRDSIQTVSINTDIDDYLLQNSIVDLYQKDKLYDIREDLIEEERLRRIIKAFEGNYE